MLMIIKFLHVNGVLNRDIKLENFLIDEMEMDVKFVKRFSEERLTHSYLDMLERSSNLYAKQLSRSEVITTIAA